MSILSRSYDLAKMADVRELLRADQRIQMSLSLAYRYNEIINRMGYLFQQKKLHEKAVRKGEDRASLIAQCDAKLAEFKLKKDPMRIRLRDLLKSFGLTGIREMPGRYAGFKSRRDATTHVVVRGFTQKSLYIFADLYSEEAMTSIQVNEIMFREGES